MRILHVRHGFQADHSSSSYLFYAHDRPVSTAGQKQAARYSSRAEVDERRARYQKWGDAGLSHEAFPTLLGGHYDVMVSESYDWWTFRLSLPKTKHTEELLAPFRDARGDDDQGVDVEEYGKHLAAVIFCRIDSSGPLFEDYDDDVFETIAQLLVKLRDELREGNSSFLQAVADFYRAKDDEEDDQDEAPESEGEAPGAHWTKEQLRQEGERRGLRLRASWTKTQLLDALTASRTVKGRTPEAKPKAKSTRPLSRAAKTLLASLDNA